MWSNSTPGWGFPSVLSFCYPTLSKHDWLLAIRCQHLPPDSRESFCFGLVTCSQFRLLSRSSLEKTFCVLCKRHLMLFPRGKINEIIKISFSWRGYRRHVTQHKTAATVLQHVCIAHFSIDKCVSFMCTWQEAGRYWFDCSYYSKSFISNCDILI